MKLVLVALSIAILYIFSGCKKASSPAPVYTIPPPLTGKTYSSPELAGFQEITIKGAYNNGTIKKLPKETFVYLADTIYAHLTTALDSIISEVNAQTDTNLVMRRTTDSSVATIRVYLTDRNTFEAKVPGAAASFNTSAYELDGLTVPFWSFQGTLNPVSVFVDMQRAAGDTSNQLFLLRHEMMHSFGFLGHVDIIDYMSSILYYFRITPRITSYSYFDKRMLHLLYDPAIKPGMGLTELNQVLVNL